MKAIYVGSGISLVASAYAAFGANVVFTVNKRNCDITSLKFQGKELQWNSKGSHIASGLGSATVSAKRAPRWSLCVAGSLTQYLIARSGNPVIYMATHITAPHSVGELRFIARIRSNEMPNSMPLGDVSKTSGGSAIEGNDVFLVNGQTRPKFYSSERFIDDKVHCIGGSGRAACMVILNYETAPGGPFMRDINTNNGGESNDLYFYMNSGHLRTEDWCMGLHGPYAIHFTGGSISDGNLDTSFFKDLGIRGYVPDSARGSMSDQVSGVEAGKQAVVHFKNKEAQYWARADDTGNYKTPLMKPGSYEMTLYQGEFPIGKSNVQVNQGTITAKNLAGTSLSSGTFWRIGDWDGQPTGFQNADKFHRMHPTDRRMTSWGRLTYTVGSSTLGNVPMALVKGKNDPFTIVFNLDANQAKAATLRIGTTLSFAGGRPQTNVNNWAGPAPSQPTKIDSRGLTRGGYRGHGEVYTLNIPAGTLVTEKNTITINVLSSSSGTDFLAPNFILDAIELSQ
ncbi:hypothetical protein P152DRAFT_463860 [Eremomyces bilateralis CBS 781.70]|uniref:rhamnogalacturonan endolyase n=1 Tax=Eremomyces bilateralis CBS 781.70 TaxID=1392243 RepID=A0A6G1GDW6_9PEZI|nr:uncharacterized protein P152DRAFT_463860 [Eremomyces bilateralis CBS 781.70]KAF1816222.1 hypothetical protein P152DRAFT_463860 [Eremomyces bilateralis CBS 781.70]